MPRRDWHPGYVFTGHAQHMLRRQILNRRRHEIYAALMMKNNGVCPCYCCRKHVAWKDSSLEHIKPRSKGGTDAAENLSISHIVCNKKRGNKV